MMLERHFEAANMAFRGAHAFRRGFAMSYLAAGGQENERLLTQSAPAGLGI